MPNNEPMSREEMEARSTTVPVKREDSPEAMSHITYHTDEANRNEAKQIRIFNARKASAPKFLNYKGRDLVKASVSEQQPDYTPATGELVFVTLKGDLALEEAEQRAKKTEELSGAFESPDKRNEVVQKSAKGLEGRNTWTIRSYAPGMTLG